MISLDIGRYKTLVFDCDGVLLDSNRIKTNAFYSVALRYGQRPAEKLVDYHRRNGGISRYIKFQYFLRELVGIEPNEMLLADLLSDYAYEVLRGLRTCPVSEAIPALRCLAPEIRRLVVSGGDQKELRTLFHERKLESVFNGGIFGSPDTKDNILNRELASKTIILPALFIGDSQYDYEVATRFGLDFLFVAGWTEFTDWREYQQRHCFPFVEALADCFPEATH